MCVMVCMSRSEGKPPLWLRQGLSLCSSCRIYQASWDPAVSVSSFIIGALVYRCRNSCPVLYALWTIRFRFPCLHSKLYTLNLLSSPCFFPHCYYYCVCIICGLWVCMSQCICDGQKVILQSRVSASIHLSWVLTLLGLPFVFLLLRKTHYTFMAIVGKESTPVLKSTWIWVSISILECGMEKEVSGVSVGLRGV